MDMSKISSDNSEIDVNASDIIAKVENTPVFNVNASAFTFDAAAISTINMFGSAITGVENSLSGTSGVLSDSAAIKNYVDNGLSNLSSDSIVNANDDYKIQAVADRVAITADGAEVASFGADKIQINYDAIVGGDLVVEESLVELSSAALKTDIAPIEGALDKIMSLQGVEFNWINKSNEIKEYGLIAEKVAEVAPNLVAFENEKAQGIKYSKMVSLLIEGMKEQQREIDELKKKLN